MPLFHRRGRGSFPFGAVPRTTRSIVRGTIHVDAATRLGELDASTSVVDQFGSVRALAISIADRVLDDLLAVVAIEAHVIEVLGCGVIVTVQNKIATPPGWENRNFGYIGN